MRRFEALATILQSLIMMFLVYIIIIYRLFALYILRATFRDSVYIWKVCTQCFAIL